MVTAPPLGTDVPTWDARTTRMMGHFHEGRAPRPLDFEHRALGRALCALCRRWCWIKLIRPAAATTATDDTSTLTISLCVMLCSWAAIGSAHVLQPTAFVTTAEVLEHDAVVPAPLNITNEQVLGIFANPTFLSTTDPVQTTSAVSRFFCGVQTAASYPAFAPMQMYEMAEQHVVAADTFKADFLLTKAIGSDLAAQDELIFRCSSDPAAYSSDEARAVVHFLQNGSFAIYSSIRGQQSLSQSLRAAGIGLSAQCPFMTAVDRIFGSPTQRELFYKNKHQLAAYLNQTSMFCDLRCARPPSAAGSPILTGSEFLSKQAARNSVATSTNDSVEETTNSKPDSASLLERIASLQMPSW